MKNNVKLNTTTTFDCHVIDNYFADVGKTVESGSGNQHKSKDVMLICYVSVQFCQD